MQINNQAAKSTDSEGYAANGITPILPLRLLVPGPLPSRISEFAVLFGL